MCGTERVQSAFLAVARSARTKVPEGYRHTHHGTCIKHDGSSMVGFLGRRVVLARAESSAPWTRASHYDAASSRTWPNPHSGSPSGVADPSGSATPPPKSKSLPINWALCPLPGTPGFSLPSSRYLLASTHAPILLSMHVHPGLSIHYLARSLFANFLPTHRHHLACKSFFFSFLCFPVPNSRYYRYDRCLFLLRLLESVPRHSFRDPLSICASSFCLYHRRLPTNFPITNLLSRSPKDFQTSSYHKSSRHSFDLFLYLCVANCISVQCISPRPHQNIYEPNRETKISNQHSLDVSIDSIQLQKRIIKSICQFLR